MLEATTSEIAGWLGIPCNFERPIRGVSIDSREESIAGRLFVGLPGSACHGGERAADAIARGAAAAIVPPAFAGDRCLVIDDTQRALQQVAANWRTRLSARVIAISGSVGKTTTRQLLAAMLGPSAHQSAGNQNNELGVPLTILGCPRAATFLVAEAAAGGPGDLAPLTRLLRPNRGILTAAGPSHLDRFGTVEAVAAEKLSLADGCDGPTLLAVENWQPKLDRSNPRIRTVGRDPRCDVMYAMDRSHPDAGTLHICGDSYRVPLPSHLDALVASAVATARDEGRPAASIQLALDSFTLAPGRGGQRQCGDWLAIDDTYNANPQSMHAAASRIARHQGGVLVAGDMLGLGEAASRLHDQTGRRLRPLRLRHILCVGNDAAVMAGASGHPFTRCHTTDDAAGELIERFAGSPFLVKGSRGARMERVFDALSDRGYRFASG